MDSESVRSGKKRVPEIEDEVSASSDVDSQTSEDRQISSNATTLYYSQLLGNAPFPSLTGISGRSPSEGEFRLFRAMRDGNVVLAKALLHDGVDVKQMSFDGQSLFSFAASRYDSKMVKLLLDAGVNPNEDERHQIGRLLAQACSRGDLWSAGLLIDAGFDVNLQLKAGFYCSALAAACMNAPSGSVEILLEAGADVNLQLTSGNYGSALAAACAVGSLSTVKLLLEKGADINMQLTSGKYGSALAAACFSESFEVVELLLEKGADVRLQLTSGKYGSALAAACAARSLSIVKLLLEKGADINMQLTSGKYGSALAAACVSGPFKTLELLLERGADVNLQLTSGKYGSALAAAATISHSENSEVIKLLLSLGAKINLQLKTGIFGSALAAAIAMKELENTRLLLFEGADASLPLCSGEFGDAITIALDSESFDTTQLLLEAGASIGPLTEALFRQPPRRLQSFVNNLKAIGMDFNTFQAECLRQTYLWDPPTVMSAIQDKRTWLFDFGALIRREDTVEFEALGRLIERSYGDMGLRLLQGFVRAASHYGEYTDGYMRLKVLPRKLEEDSLNSESILSLETTTCTPEILEAMQLICRVIRAPSPGRVCISTIRQAGDMVFLEKLLPFPSSSRNNNCWHGLFDSAVIGLLQDIDQTIPCRGLVLDFKILLGLSAVEYPLLVDSGTILMGYSTALIPIRETEDGMILWHLEIAKDDFQLKVANLEAIKHDWLRSEPLKYLQSKKALLGWCSKAHILLGTDRLTPEVTWSAARHKPITWKWKGANLQGVFQTASPIQIGLQAGGSFERMSNRLRFDPSVMYLKCLRSSAPEQIIVYDVSAKRAWLVPLLSVLHHMLLVYVHSVEQESLVSNAPVVDFLSDGTSDSLKALRDKGDIVIEGSGNHTLSIAQLIMKFSINMSRLSPQKPKRSTIYGYEFMDIVMDSTRSELKKETLQKEGLAWLSLLGEFNCLFCSRIGEAIVGDRALDISLACNRLPRGNDFLAASMQSIETLSLRHGGSDQIDSRRLSPKHFWQLTGSPFKKCNHANYNDSCWQCPEFLQEIQTHQCSGRVNDQSMDNCANGALVFGSLVNSKSVEHYSAPLTFLPGNPARGDIRAFPSPQMSDV